MDRLLHRVHGKLDRHRVKRVAKAAVAWCVIVAHTGAYAQAPIGNAQDGQQLGQELLNTGAAIMKNMTPGSASFQQGNSGGSKTDVTVVPGNPNATSATFNLREIIPGADANALQNAQGIFGSGGNAALQDAATAARRTSLRSGCRETHFVAQGDGTSSSALDSVVITITAISRSRTTVAAPTATSPNARRLVTVDSPMVYNGAVPAEAFTFSTLGDASRTHETVIQAPVIDGAAGTILKTTTTPFSAARDGTYFSYGTRVVAGSVSTVPAADNGTIANGFTPSFPGLWMNGQTLSISSQLWKTSQIYQPLPSGGACPADPPSCPFEGIDFCNAPGLGVAATMAPPTSGTNGRQEAAVEGATLLQSMAHSQFFVPTTNQDVQNIVSGARPIQQGTHPIFDSELFSDCVTVPASGAGASYQVHHPKIESCLNFRTTMFAPLGCVIQRTTHLTLLQAATPLISFTSYKQVPATPPETGYTIVPSVHSQGFGVDFLAFGFGYTVNTPIDGDGTFFQINVMPFWPSAPLPADPARFVFTNVKLVPFPGSTVPDITFTQWGAPSNNWHILGGGVANAVTGFNVVADIYLVSEPPPFAAIAGDPACQDYMNVLADGVCVPQTGGSISCQDSYPGAPQSVIDGVPVSFDGTGLAAGAAEVFPPWSVAASGLNLAPVSCTKVSGPPLQCDNIALAMNCTTDAQGLPVCTTATGLTLKSHFGDTNFQDNCGDSEPGKLPLISDPQCKQVTGPKQDCETDASGQFSGTCYAYQVRYDCGTDETVTAPSGANGNTTTCNGPIRCMGTECTNPVEQDSAKDFYAVATAAALLDDIQNTNLCAETKKQPLNPGAGPQFCTLNFFGGEQAKCRIPVGSNLGGASVTSNCCDPKGMGSIDPMLFFKMAEVAKKVYSTPYVQEALVKLYESNETAQTILNTGQTIFNGYEELAAGLKDGLSAAMDSTVAFFQNAFESVAQELGFDTAASELASELGTDVAANAIEAALTEELGNAVAGGAIDTGVMCSAAATQAVEQQGVSMMLDVLLEAYSVWGWVKLIGTLITACTPDEMKLAMNKQTGLCHPVGSFCSKKALACVEQTKTYCCFDSLLHRVIQEQVRDSATDIPPGQGLFGGWGPDIKKPVCEGFSVEQLAQIDWTRVDLSEYTAALIKGGLLPGAIGGSSTPTTTSVITNPSTGVQTIAIAPENKKVADMYGVDLNPFVSVLGIKQDRLPAPKMAKAVTPTKTAQLTDAVTKYATTVEANREALAKMPTCYYDSRPDLAPWYQAPAELVQTDIFDDVVGNTTPCGPGCAQFQLGTPGFVSGNCSVVSNTSYSINVKRPDLIESVTMVAAAFDDHMQVTVNGAITYEGPDDNPYFHNPILAGVSGNTTANSYITDFDNPDMAKMKCELGTVWYIGNPSICPKACASAGLTSVDMTAAFKQSGWVTTNLRLLVGDLGIAKGVFEIRYRTKPLPDASNMLNAESCFTPDGGFIDRGKTTTALDRP